MAIETKFQDKTARVVLVDSSGPVRQLLSEVSKGIGFSNSQSVSSLADAHNLLETESVDWLIVPLNGTQDVNGLQTVRMVINFAELKGVKVSLLVEDTEAWALSKAFEFGLLSFHMKPFTKDSLTKELEELMRIFAENDWDAARTSSEYLRKHLRATNQAADLLTLEKSLLELFPGNTKLLICLAEALHVNGQTDKAKATLKQVEFIDTGSAATIKEKRAALFGADAGGPDAAPVAGENILGLGVVVIIDGDDSVRSAVRAIFNELGVKDIFDFADGDAAFEWFRANPEPSLVIMEWRIPKVTGPLLLQRIRSKGAVNVPIILLSSLIKPMDMPIIREMGVANLAQKPMERDAFLKVIIWTVQQDRMPTEAQTMENKIRAYISNKKIGDAEELIARYLANEGIAPGRKAVMRAEHAFAKDQFKAACDFSIEAIRQSGESLFALNILGKSLMTLRQFEPALKCFQKAQGLSPTNLERLVMMAETQAEMVEPLKADESINKAKDIDPNSTTTIEGEAKVALAGGSPEAAKEILGQLESMSNVISYLNNKAVAHAKCGFSEEGIKLYEKTLAAIPSAQRDILSIVNYNMALAKIRFGDFSGALPDLDAVISITESRVHKKAADLKARLEPAVITGKPFSLREVDAANAPEPAPTSKEEGQTADASTLVTVMLEQGPGDHCCYLLFKTTSADSPELTKALAVAPKFKARKSLERGETFAGADGTKTAS